MDRYKPVKFKIYETTFKRKQKKYSTTEMITEQAIKEFTSNNIPFDLKDVLQRCLSIYHNLDKAELEKRKKSKLLKFMKSIVNDMVTIEGAIANEMGISSFASKYR